MHGSVRVFSFPQVNGKELSKSSHEETVEAFRAAKDPVVVQVIRRTPSGRPHGPPQEIHVVDVCTQTDITFEHIMALAKLRPSTPPVPDVCPFLLSDRCVQYEVDAVILHFCLLGMRFGSAVVWSSILCVFVWYDLFQSATELMLCPCFDFGWDCW